MKNIYDLSKHLDRIYAAGVAAKARPAAENFASWQKKKRAELRHLLGIAPVAVKASHKHSSHQWGGVSVERFDLEMSDGTVMPLYVGRPTKSVFRPLIIFHGHADGAQTLFGHGMTKARQDYALAFVRAGYTVFAPDLRGFRERLGPSPIHHAGYTRSCRQLSFDLMLMGRTLVGERVADGMALISWMQRTYPSSAPTLVTGNSGGGTVALLAAALDTRVDAAAIGSAFCTYKESILAMSHCECNYVPGMLTRFREIADIAGLVAPRKLLVIHGAEDPIFPIRGVRAALKEVRELYRLSGTNTPVESHMHDGAHWYEHSKALPFFNSLV